MQWKILPVNQLFFQQHFYVWDIILKVFIAAFIKTKAFIKFFEVKLGPYFYGSGIKLRKRFFYGIIH